MTTETIEKIEREFVNLRIPVPWGHIAGRWYGNRNVRPILALHGWLDNLGTWHNLLPLLPAHVGVVCIDLPGHGQSSNLPKGIAYHQMDYVTTIILVMRAYNWQKVSLLAHSLSAMISYLFAAIFPERVDMIISIDVVKPNTHTPDEHLTRLTYGIEKYMIEDVRFANPLRQEPPSYTYEHLVELQNKGTGGSVDFENTHYLLERNITKSNLYPAKYYFSRDGRVKYYVEFNLHDYLMKEMTKRLCNIPFCVIKGSDSVHIGKSSEEVIKILSENNSQFEMHVINGTHHVHLNNAAECAAVINPFINKHRPPLLESWTIVDANEPLVGKKKQINQYKKERRKIYDKWVKSKL